jgi:signal recognition particle subunit SRP54
MLDSLRDGLQNAVKKLVGVNTVDEKAVKEFVRDLQRALIQADVNVKVALAITERVEKRALEEKPKGGVTRKDQIVTILYEELSHIMGPEGETKFEKAKTSVVVMIGVQGSGKTTTTAKLARLYSKRGFRVGVVAADTFRPGAVAQLQPPCALSGAEVFSDKNREGRTAALRRRKEHDNHRHRREA